MSTHRITQLLRDAVTVLEKPSTPNAPPLTIDLDTLAHLIQNATTILTNMSTHNLTMANDEATTLLQLIQQATSLLPTLPSPGQQQMTGQAIFWPILAIALNTMAQSSISASTLLQSREVFGGPITPCLSSPVWCLVDAALEGTVLARTVLRRWGMLAELSPTSDTTKAFATPQRSTRGALAMRIGFFILGVVPNAIALFAMPGIPILQTIAAIFLLTTLLRAICVLAAPTCQPERERVQAWLRHNDTTDRPILRLKNLTLAAHTLMYATIWHAIGNSLSIPSNALSKDFAAACAWLAVALAILVPVISAVWITGMLFVVPWMFRLWRPQISPLCFAFPLVYILGYPGRVVRGHRDQMPVDPLWQRVLLYALPSAVVAGLGSYGVAVALVWGIKWVSGMEGEGGGEVQVLDGVVGDGGTDVTATDDEAPASMVVPSREEPVVVAETGSPDEQAGILKEPLDPFFTMFITGCAAIFPLDWGSDDTNPTTSPPSDGSSTNTDEQLTNAPTPTTQPPPSQDPAIIERTATSTPPPPPPTTTITPHNPSEPPRKRRPRRPLRNTSSQYSTWLRQAALFKLFRATILPAFIASQQTHPTPSRPQRLPLRQRLRSGVIVTAVAVLLFLAQTVVFAVLAGFNLVDVGPGFRWAGRVIGWMEAEVMWVGFAVFNGVTLGGWCFGIFEGGGGGGMPRWTGLLGG